MTKARHSSHHHRGVKALTILPLCLMAGGCTGLGGFGGLGAALPSILSPGSGSQAMAREGMATLRMPDGREVGRAMLQPMTGGTRVSVETMGLREGSYAMHIHAIGRCDAPDFTTAGPHWNPAMRQHGSMNPMGAHAGDLPNLRVGRDGRGVVSVDLANIALSGGTAAMLDADGAAIVLHAQPDDMRTDPSGNSGARIACGVIAAR